MKFLVLMGFQDYLLLAYAFVGTISAFGYGPQIWALLTSKTRSMSTPISTWALWSVEALVALAYAVFIVKDVPMMIFMGIDVLAAMMITGLTVYNRYYRPSTQRALA